MTDINMHDQYDAEKKAQKTDKAPPGFELCGEVFFDVQQTCSFLHLQKA
jgi:hypothetical protein